MPYDNRIINPPMPLRMGTVNPYLLRASQPGAPRAPARARPVVRDEAA